MTDILRRVSEFKKREKKISQISVRARNGDYKAAIEILEIMAESSVDGDQLFDDLVQEVKNLRKQLKGK